MSNRSHARVLLSLAAALAACGCRAERPSPPPANAARRAAPVPAVVPRFGELPLRFEPNVGQFDARIRFVARDGRSTLFLTDDDATLRLRPSTGDGAAVQVRFTVHDARPSHPVARRQMATHSNYFLGNSPAKWRTGVPSFAEVVYAGVRPGVDLVYHGASGGRLEYDFVVAPGASSDVALDVSGADGLHLAADGALEIRVRGGVLRQPPPTVYQIIDGRRRVLTGAYRLVDRARVAVAVAAYDRSRPLVIDPVLVYSTYLGSSGDDFAQYSAAVDGNGSVYVVGYTSSTSFPTANALQPSHSGGTHDAFVAKLTPAGDALVYSTYLGGSSNNYAHAVAVDADGAAYVGGMTMSSDFPTKNSIQPYAGSSANGYDAFVLKLTPAGDALVYSTYLGGHAHDRVNCLAIDATGAAYVAGITTSTDFPTVNALQSSFAGGSGDDGWFAKLNPAGSALVYSSYFGGTKNEYLTGIAVDANGSAYLAGSTQSTDLPVAHALYATNAGADDAYVAKLVPAGNALVYASYLGGAGEDYAYAVAVDAAGAAYVVGQTASSGFPTANALQATVAGTDAFVTKLTPAGDALAYSTFLGGSTTDWAYGLAVDGHGAAYVTGATLSTDFPVSHAVQQQRGGGFDAFVSKLVPSGASLAYSTYLGGSNQDEAHGIAVGAAGAVYITGWTSSTNFPTTAGAFQATNAGGFADAFVAKLAYPPLVVTPASVTLPPRGAQIFVASGGSDEGHAWALTSNGSGGSVDANGHYTAGATGSVTDVVTLTDTATDVTATATITVTAGVTIIPASATVQVGEAVAFSAAGGSGTGYAWSVDSGGSGTVDAATGAYVAGTSGGADTIRVVDSLGNVATATVTVVVPPADLGDAPADLGDAPADLGDAPADLADSPADAGTAADMGHGAPGGCGCDLGGAGAASPSLASILALLAFAVRRRIAGRRTDA